MNKVELLGRLTNEPDVRYTNGANGQFAIGKFTLAVDRKYKKDGEQTADFIGCVAMGKQAEFVEKYLKKGTKVAVCGRIQTGKYTNKNGDTVYTTDVIVEEVEFAESKAASSSGGSNSVPTTKDTASDFMAIPDGVDDDLPFN